MCQVQPACTVALNGQAVAVPASAGPTHVAAPVPMQGPTPGGVDNPLPSIFRPLGLLSLVRLLLIGYHTRLAAARGAQSALGGTTTYGRPGRCARLHQHTTAAAAPARVVRRAGEVRKPQGWPPRPSCLPCRAAAPIRRLCTRQGWQQQGGSVTPLAAAARDIAGPACRRRLCILSSASMTAAGTSCTHSPSCCLSLLQATTSRAPRGSTAGHYPGCSGAAECAARRCGATCRWRHKPAPVFHAQPHGSWSV